jgi:hypothetical protein
MRVLFVFTLAFLAFSGASGQQSPVAAITQDGRKVLLYPDGTWKLADQAQPQSSQAIGNNSAGDNNRATDNRSGPGNPPPMGQNQNTEGGNNPPANSKVFVKAPQGRFGLWIDQQKWTQNPSNNDPIKIIFTHQGETSYAMVIAEKARVSMEALERAALINAKKVSPDMTLLFKEKRVVNGKSVLCLQMTGTVQGTSFMYYGYYYGGPEGTLQVICYTTPEQFDQAKTDFDELLSSITFGG